MSAPISERIQALLGHKKLDTTARYVHVATGMISAVASPLDRLAATSQCSGEGESSA